jgi:hypothetical protein
MKYSSLMPTEVYYLCPVLPVVVLGFVYLGLLICVHMNKIGGFCTKSAVCCGQGCNGVLVSYKLLIMLTMIGK